MLKPCRFLLGPTTGMVLLACSLPVFAQSGSTSAKDPSVSFRQSNIGVTPPQTLKPAVPDSQLDEQSLADKRQTLESELDYSKAKLERAQKQLTIQSQTGNVEQADKLEQEVKDWEARVQAQRSELADLAHETESVAAASGPGESGEVIVPGENLEVFVVEDPSFNGRYQVRRGGYILLPQVGRIGLAGKTVSQAEATVRRALQASQLQHATVLVERVSGSDVAAGPQIYLSGEFRAPRPYRIPAGTAPTLVSVFLSCGGVTDKADITRVKVMRIIGGKSVVEQVNVQRILDGGSLASDLTLSEGDVISVPAGESNLVYLTGRVARPGSFRLTYGEKLTAYSAILQNGGFGRFADLRKIYLLRAMPDGTKTRVALDVVAIQKGQRPDVLLQPSDIVVVPEKFFSF